MLRDIIAETADLIDSLITLSFSQADLYAETYGNNILYPINLRSLISISVSCLLAP